MAASTKEQREKLARVGEVLDAGMTLPTDTMITDGIPLLLTRLSQIPRAPGSPKTPTK